MGTYKPRVLLIDPPTKAPQSLNIGLGWLASNLRDACEDVSVLALANIHCSPELAGSLLRNKVKTFNPDVIGFNVHCTTYKITQLLAKGLRSYYKGLVVIGGPHVVYERKKVLDQIPEADAALMGESEGSFSLFCGSSREQYPQIEGLIYRDHGLVKEVAVTGKRKEFGDLRHPDYRQFGVNRIYAPYPLSTSRGCPFQCSFCNPFMGGRSWRPRPFNAVFEELEFACRMFDIRSFVIVEPVFNLKEDRVIEFCDEIRKRKIKLPWFPGSGLRADCVTVPMIRAMKEAGCSHIKIGVESLVPEVFKHVNKGETLDEIRRAVKIIKQERIPLIGSFIIGLPYDTLQRARLNFTLSQQMGFDHTEWSLLFPYPGTPAFDWMMANGKIYHTIETAHQTPNDLYDQDFTKSLRINIACDTEDFTREERERAFWEINTRSGNYIFSPKNPDQLNARLIIGAIWEFDRMNVVWHAQRLMKLLDKRKKTMNKKGQLVEFNDDAFEGLNR